MLVIVLGVQIVGVSVWLDMACLKSMIEEGKYYCLEYFESLE